MPSTPTEAKTLKVVAYACSSRPNAMWSAAQFNNALPKNRTECDTPLVALSDAESIVTERNLFKGKYRALLKLISRTRNKLVLITDYIEDEGDRRYFGSTNHADELRELYHEMMRWIWDATDETNRMKSDPYADIRKQRARAEKAEVANASLLSLIEDMAKALEAFSNLSEVFKHRAANRPAAGDDPIFAWADHRVNDGEALMITVGDLMKAREAHARYTEFLEQKNG